MVGYLAASLSRVGNDKKKATDRKQSFFINKDDREYLHRVVRETIRAALDGTKPSYESRDSRSLQE